MEDIKVILDIIDKARFVHKQKSGTLAYWLKVENRFLLHNVSVSFLKKDRKEALKTIREVQSKEGFLFWANSPEGEKFFNDNYNKISLAIKSQQTKPWVEYEYGVKRNEL